jgi:hypothetical protein
MVLRKAAIPLRRRTKRLGCPRNMDISSFSPLSWIRQRRHSRLVVLLLVLLVLLWVFWIGYQQRQQRKEGTLSPWIGWLIAPVRIIGMLLEYHVFTPVFPAGALNLASHNDTLLLSFVHSFVRWLVRTMAHFSFWDFSKKEAHSYSHILSILYFFGGTFSRMRVAPWFFWDRWQCRPRVKGRLPMNRHGIPSYRFGVLLLFVPEGGSGSSDNTNNGAAPTQTTMTPEQREMWHMAEQNRIEYCQRHGYTFLNGTAWAEQATQRERIHRLENRTHMLKPIVLLDIIQNMGGPEEKVEKSNDVTPLTNEQQPLSSLSSFQYPDEELDWILFLDTDIVILNMDISIEEMIAGVQPNEGMVLSTEADRVNTGALVVANTIAGRALLQAWSTGANTPAWDSDQWYFYTLFQPPRGSNKDNKDMDRRLAQPWPTPLLVTDKVYPGDVRIDTTIPSLKGISSSSTTTILTSSTQPNKFPSTNTVGDHSSLHNNITYKVVSPCLLQSCGGLEYSKTLGRPYWEGFYMKGDFAVHFFGKRDKLSLMQLAYGGSLSFFS